MNGLLTVLVVVAALVLLGLALSVRIVQQYERDVLFRLGQVVGPGAGHLPGQGTGRGHPSPSTHHASQRARRPSQLPIAYRRATGDRGRLQHRLPGRSAHRPC